ncbi:hypothetical protein P154DRAFT_624293 [Amniculicola lignicola CBS 123094]|uniref:Ecp2 effector protein domain-containing protein n=1 Tax=Amniculicola lignicola CBS 123094 TaxID=1392246 RepID=A0A6A5W004_9PLEO|nr:hypothetical protein P154DRAFT_624293 [Amniculicola lignicola CBS 123094]
MPSLTSVLLSTLPLIAITLATPVHPHPRRAQNSTVRTGKINVFLPNPPGSQIPGQPVGCLDLSGRLAISSSNITNPVNGTVDAMANCAIYTHEMKDNTGFAKTKAGDCGFHDPSEPDNPDSPGTSFRAWRCKEGLVRAPDGEDVLIISDNKPYNNLQTVSGSGVNWGIFSKSVPEEGEPVDIFTRDFDLGEGSIDLVWLWDGN